MKFWYSIIRYVPNVVRGEFINIGAIVVNDNEDRAEYRWRVTEDWTRAKKLDASLVSSIREYLKIELPQRLGTPEKKGARRFLDQFRYDLQNCVQIREPLPMCADSHEDALNLVFPKFVVEEEESTESHVPELIVALKDFVLIYDDSAPNSVLPGEIIHQELIPLIEKVEQEISDA